MKRRFLPNVCENRKKGKLTKVCEPEHALVYCAAPDKTLREVEALRSANFTRGLETEDKNYMGLMPPERALRDQAPSGRRNHLRGARLSTPCSVRIYAIKV